MLFEAYTSYQTKRMNDLLDKGFKNLTASEKDELKNIDKLKEPVDKPVESAPVNTGAKSREDFDSDMGDFVNQKKQDKIYTDSTDTVIFRLIETSECKTHYVFKGAIQYNDDLYFGYIFNDRVTEEPTYKFTNMKGVGFEPADHDLHYEFDDLLQQVIYDETIK